MRTSFRDLRAEASAEREVVMDCVGDEGRWIIGGPRFPMYAKRQWRVERILMRPAHDVFIATRSPHVGVTVSSMYLGNHGGNARPAALAESGSSIGVSPTGDQAFPNRYRMGASVTCSGNGRRRR